MNDLIARYCAYFDNRRTTKPGEFYQKYVKSEDKEKFKSLKSSDLAWDRDLLGDIGNKVSKDIFVMGTYE